MNEQLVAYIKAKRELNQADDQIRANLLTAGWPVDLVDSALKADLSGDAPPPPPPVTANPTYPAPVVNLATTRGIEYTLMFIGLWISATAIGSLLHDAVDTVSGRNEDYYGGASPFASAALIVSLPIFVTLYLRLKKAELKDSQLHNDPSRKKAIQITLLVTFLIGVFKIMSYVFSLLSGGDTGGFFGDYPEEETISPIFDILHMVITLGIAGGIFAYYWRDIHKKDA